MTALKAFCTTLHWHKWIFFPKQFISEFLKILLSRYYFSRTENKYKFVLFLLHSIIIDGKSHRKTLKTTKLLGSHLSEIPSKFYYPQHYFTKTIQFNIVLHHFNDRPRSVRISATQLRLYSLNLKFECYFLCWQLLDFIVAHARMLKRSSYIICIVTDRFQINLRTTI